jgi:GNAT superfamily N-acetyltransferase
MDPRSSIDDFPAFAIREAMPDDSAPIAKLISQLGYVTRPDEMAERLRVIGADPSYHTLVAVVDSVVVAVAGIGIGYFYERNGRYGRLLVFVVQESQWGNGIGRALLREAESWALSKRATVMVVNSGHERVGAHAFYTAAGYSSTGLRFIKALSEAV